MGASLYLGAGTAVGAAVGAIVGATDEATDDAEEAAWVGGTAVGGTAVGGTAVGGTGVAVGGGGAHEATTAPTAIVDNRKNSRREIVRFILLSSFGIITLLVLYG